MNWSNIRLIFVREVRDQLRDRRTLFMIAVLPLLLYPLLGMSIFQVAQFMQEHPTKVLVVGESELNNQQLPRLFENGHFTTALFSTPEQSRLLQVGWLSKAATSSSPAEEKSTKNRSLTDQLTEARSRLKQGEAQVVVYFPPGFGTRLDQVRIEIERRLRQPGRHPSIDDTKASLQLIQPQIYHNSASEPSQIAYTRVLSALQRWSQTIWNKYLLKSYSPELTVGRFDFNSQDVAEQHHRDAALWSKVLPFVLLIWALTGAFYPAVDLCAGEKERGTLETLLSSPAKRTEIVWAKLLTVMIFSIITAVLNLLSIGLTGTFILAQLNHLSMAGPSGSIHPPPASVAIWLLIALIPVSALFSALCLALAAFARSTKEGQYYLMPLVLIITPLMILPMAPGVELNLGNSIIPITGVMLLLRAMMEGNNLQALLYAPPVLIVTIGCCLFAIRWAVDQFNQESVLFRESERLEMGLWMKHLIRNRDLTPTASEAVSCFILILLIQFFMNLAIPAPRPDVFADLAVRLFIGLVVIIALPALLMSLLFTKSPATTLLLNKPPPFLSIPGALLLALALHPVAHTVQWGIQQLYPINDTVAAQAEILQGLINGAPNLWWPILLVCLLPAVCEEVAFRGFILSGLRHLGHKWWSIVLSAIFFGIAHGLLQQSIMASLMGVVLGYLAVQTGSLIPCIIFHLTHNLLLLLAAKLELSPTTLANIPGLTWFIQVTGEQGVGYRYAALPVALGTVVTAALMVWLHRLPYAKSPEEQLQEALGEQGGLAEEV